jgi:septum formation protein
MSVITKIVLASDSPRRAELLAQIGVRFEVMRPEIDESPLSNESAIPYVERMSHSKYHSIRSLEGERRIPEECIVLCADTIVVLDTEILGKPKSKEDGIQMLEDMSGKVHKVITSVTIGQYLQENSFFVETIVKFRILKREECVAYWLTGEPQDKAGGYAIQGIGSIFVEKISGSYSNVVGLPLMETSQALEGFGLSMLQASVAC